MANPRRLPRLRRVGRGLLSVSVSFAALVVSIGLFPGSAHSKVKFHPLSDQIKRFEDVVIRPHHTLHRRDTLDKRHTTRFTLPLRAFNVKLDLELAPALKLFAPNATLHHTDAHGVSTTVPINAHGYYSGRIIGKDGSYAHVNIRPDGSVAGIVVDGAEGYHIDPRTDYVPGAAPHEHVIYRESDMDYVKAEGGARALPVDVEVHAPGDSDGAQGARGESSRGRQRRASTAKVKAAPYVIGRSACHVALFADKEFIAETGSREKALVKMLQRFSVAQNIFLQDVRFATPTYRIPITITVARVKLDESATLDTSVHKDGGATGYLSAFSLENAAGERDWDDVCLAHAFTHRDFSGTLGLAWMGKKNSDRANGGVCQAQYNSESSGGQISLNTGFTTSLSYGSKQPELQMSLVLTHEFGHNLGAPHDPEVDKVPASGHYIMYPFAQVGAQADNDLFSTYSVRSMSDVIADRGGCMVGPATATCGDFMRAGEEECDCGGTATFCAAMDPCCTGSCKLAAGAACSPMDQEHGFCCTKSCSIKAGTTCKDQSVCMAASTCDATGKCATPQPRRVNSICENGIETCEGGKCSGLCDTGGNCTGSICALWNQVACELTGGIGCEIKCKASGAADTTCKFTSELGATAVAGYNAQGGVAVAAEYAGSKYRAGSSKCEYEVGKPTSGICSKAGNCLKADTEEGAMAELNRMYKQRLDTFLTWLEDDQRGVANYVWLLLAGALLTMCCCAMCYVCNHETHMCLGQYTGQGQNKIVPFNPQTAQKTRVQGYAPQQHQAQQQKHPVRPY